MRQRRLGASGPRVSSLGLGCMGMSEFYGPSDDAASLRTLARALELGVSLFDTADTYGLGHNESLLGRFIAEGGAARRQRMVLATKFGIVRAAGQYERRIDNSPAYLRAACAPPSSPIAPWAGLSWPPPWIRASLPTATSPSTSRVSPARPRRSPWARTKSPNRTGARYPAAGFAGVEQG